MVKAALKRSIIVALKLVGLASAQAPINNSNRGEKREWKCS
jgi:hypothetical protein